MRTGFALTIFLITLIPVLVMGTQDASAQDASAQDASAQDASAQDASAQDASAQDAGVPDTGVPDTGVPDAGVPDAGVPDAGVPDAGAQDASAQGAGELHEVDLANIGETRLASATAAEFDKLTPRQIKTLGTKVTALKPGVIKDIDPATIAAFDDEQLKELTPAQVAEMTAAQLRLLTNNQIKSLKPEAIARLSDAVLTTISEDFAASFGAALSSEQYKALRAMHPNLPEALKRAHKAKKTHDAIQPGVRLLGDSYADLVESAGEANGAEASFGAGLEVESNQGRIAVFVRKGSRPANLKTTGDFSRTILSPQTESFLFGIEALYTGFDRWWEKKNPFRYLEEKNILAGVWGRGYASRTNWQLDLPQNSGEIVSLESDARTFFMMGGPALRYNVSQGRNDVELLFRLGYGVRWLDLERHVDERFLDITRAGLMTGEDPAVAETTFVERALGENRTLWHSLEAGVDLRLNQIEIRVSVSYISGDSIGVSGWRFVPSLTLRTGPQLIDW